MSHFSTVRTKITDLESLIEALRVFGFEPIVHEQPQYLRGYQNGQKAQTAHVVIPREQIPCCISDIGFLRQDDFYQMIIDDEELKYVGKDRHGNRMDAFPISLMNEYQRIIVLKTAAKLGDTVEVTKTANGYEIRVKSKPKQTVKRIGSTQTSSKIKSRY